jgi:hypothetical protein
MKLSERSNIYEPANPNYQIPYSRGARTSLLFPAEALSDETRKQTVADNVGRSWLHSSILYFRGLLCPLQKLPGTPSIAAVVYDNLTAEKNREGLVPLE